MSNFIRKNKKGSVRVPKGLVYSISQIEWKTYLTLSACLYFVFFASEHLSFTVTDFLYRKFTLSFSFVENTASFLIILTLLLSFLSAVGAYRLKKNYPKLTLNKLLGMGWEDLEKLSELLFMHSGYRTKSAGGARADGGVDLYIYKKGVKSIVQCKHYKSSNVGVSIVREMYGVMMHENAKKVYIITCGNFTRDAVSFAKNKPIVLINGEDFVHYFNKRKIK